MKKKLLILFILIPVVALVTGIGMARHHIHEFCKNNNPSLRTERVFLPEEGVVPDEKAALAWAKQVWGRKYGRLYLLPYEYDVSLQEDHLWVIEGLNIFHVMFRVNGGGPYIVIDKYTGEVITVTRTA